MANNTTLNPGVGGDIVIDEDIGGVKMPVSKIRLGAAGVDGGDVTTANPFPVAVQGTVPISAAALPALSGTTAVSIAATVPVSAVSLPALSGTTAVSIAGTVAISAASLPALSGTTAISAASLPALSGTSGVNVAQINAVTPLMGNGVTGTGSCRVTVASDNTAFQVKATGNAGASFDGATGAAVPANGLLAGLRAATANPTNATGGNMVSSMGDKAGRQVVTPVQVRDLVAVQQTNVAVNTEITVITAGAAGVFNDMVGMVVSTAGLAAQTITIKDATAGTTRFVLNYPNAAVAPAGPLVIMFPVPVPQAAAANNWTVTQSLTTACNYTFLFAKNT